MPSGQVRFPLGSCSIEAQRSPLVRTLDFDSGRSLVPTLPALLGVVFWGRSSGDDG